MRSKIFALIKRATILTVCTLQGRVIEQWNENFVGFYEMFLTIAKMYPMKRNLHFSGK